MAKYRIKVEVLDPKEKVSEELLNGWECNGFFMGMMDDIEDDDTFSTTIAIHDTNAFDMAKAIYKSTDLMEAAMIAHGMPSALARAVERAATTKARPTTQQTPTEAAEGPQETAQGDAGNASAKAADAGQKAGAADAQYAGLPDALVRMMREAGVTPDEVRYVIAQKGIYPANTPWAVICGNEQFMQGWLMHPQVWPKVVEMAKQIRDEVPF